MSKGYKAVPYNELCRLCAQSTTRRIEIFGEEGRLRQLAKSIQKLLCINITEGDPLPKTICSFCLNRVEDFKEFHSSCLSASQFLHLKLPSVEKSSGKCYVSVGVPVRPACLKRKMARNLKAPIEMGSAPGVCADVDLASTNKVQDEEEVEVREYEECVQQPKEDYNADVFLKLLEDTMNTDCLLQDHDYLSIDELLGHDSPKKSSGGKHIGKVMPVQDHDYLSSYDNPMTPTVTHQELLDHNYFTSLGPFADNFVNLLTPEEEGKFIEHNYFLPSASTQNIHSNFTAPLKTIQPSEDQISSKEEDIMDYVKQEQCELCGAVFTFCQGHECSADYERQCENCGDIFMTSSDFSSHKCSNHTELTGAKLSSEIQCEVCGSVFDGLIHHYCLADFDRQCHKCGLVFHTLKLFEEHDCTSKQFKFCSFCIMKFRSRKMLKHHILGHLEINPVINSKGPFTCQICQASYRRLAFYNQHMDNHGKKTVLLPTDAKNIDLAQKSKLKLNFEISSQPNESKIQYKCDQCQKQFSCNSNLALHRRLHSRAYSKYTCEICNAKFIKQTDYCKHVTSHLVNYKFPCDECSKGFDSYKSLENHKVRHNANKKIKSVLKARKECNIILK